MHKNKKQLPFGIIDFIQKTDFQSWLLLDDLKNYLESKGFTLEKDQNKFESSVKNFYKLHGKHIDDPEKPGSKKEVLYLTLHNEGLKTAIDYIQLKEAREFSKSSLCRSTIAIGIAILFGAASMWFNSNLVSNPTVIDLSQDTKSFLKELPTKQVK